MTRTFENDEYTIKIDSRNVDKLIALVTEISCNGVKPIKYTLKTELKFDKIVGDKSWYNPKEGDQYLDGDVLIFTFSDCAGMTNRIVEIFYPDANERAISHSDYFDDDVRMTVEYPKWIEQYTLYSFGLQSVNQINDNDLEVRFNCGRLYCHRDFR
jgi:hypothetical protein